MSNRSQISINVAAETRATLQQLSAATRVAQSLLIREALEDLFIKYSSVLGNKKPRKSKE
jgi:predicted transcriptional regulator